MNSKTLLILQSIVALFWGAFVASILEGKIKYCLRGGEALFERVGISKKNAYLVRSQSLFLEFLYITFNGFCLIFFLFLLAINLFR